MSTFEDFQAFCPEDVLETFHKNLKVVSYNCTRISNASIHHAAHCLVYAKHEQPILKHIAVSKHIILMQSRFDGSFGFHGGLIDTSDESVESGLMREIYEETGTRPHVTTSDHLITVTPRKKPEDTSKRRHYHFYVKELSLEEMRKMERNMLDAEYYGDEVLGIVRVPDYILPYGVNGLPKFLQNQFANDCNIQLLYALWYHHLIPHNVLCDAMNIAASHSKK